MSVFKVTDAQGHYLFDFVEPGTYTVSAELTGFKKAERKAIRVQQRGDVTANLTLVDRHAERDGHGAGRGRRRCS